jgi:hypothetical protein
MAINNKPASAYAANGTGTSNMKSAVTKSGNGISEINMSVGGVSKGNYAPEKTTGIKQRGAGAATKGFTSRGPMA